MNGKLLIWIAHSSVYWKFYINNSIVSNKYILHSCFKLKKVPSQSKYFTKNNYSIIVAYIMKSKWPFWHYVPMKMAANLVIMIQYVGVKYFLSEHTKYCSSLIFNFIDEYEILYQYNTNFVVSVDSSKNNFCWQKKMLGVLLFLIW